MNGSATARPCGPHSALHGIGFLTAGKVAEKLGIAKTAMIRVRAGVSYALAEAMDEGHCGLPADDLAALTAKLLEVPAALIDTALLELETGAVEGRRCVFLAGLYRAEQVIAERLRAIAAGRPSWPAIDAGKAIPWVERRTGLALADSQKQALGLAVACKALVITGGPGVGKTTLVNSILRVLRAKDIAVALCAPTGRAAKRLTESTGLEARTIHRLLETDPRTGSFKRDEEHPLECDLLVVDEASMVDVPLMRSLLQALPDTAALLIVGDVDQLPSVGPGQVLADIIGSGAIPVVRLIEVFRQAAQSQVIVNAHRVNRGQMPDLIAREGSDFFFVDAADPEEGVRKLLAVVRERIPARFGLDPVRDVQVLCPMNRGGLGARALNLALQQALNPPGEKRVERFGWTFCPGDKVMQGVNDYDRDVFNGDLGVITAVDPDEGELRVSFDGLVLAYATTIHKAQGSEYPAVVIPLSTQHYAMLARNLLYTGLTRGKRLVVLVGQHQTSPSRSGTRAGAEGKRRRSSPRRCAGSRQQPRSRAPQKPATRQHHHRACSHCRSAGRHWRP